VHEAKKIITGGLRVHPRCSFTSKTIPLPSANNKRA